MVKGSKGATHLSEQQLEDQFQQIIHFLSAVHPSLLSGEGYRPCVELRPILRVEPADHAKNMYALKRSLQIWDLEERSRERLRAFLKKHNGKPTCLYYSVFDYNNNADALKANGEKAKTGKITNASAMGAQEIALDFDNIGFEDYTKLVDRFEALGIYALWVSSGHGYQAHILLEQRVAEKRALQQMVYKFRSKGFNCDPTCVDPARVMRLPATYNLKCLKDPEYAHERENPPLCSVVQETTERYSLETIFVKLDTLPTVSIADEDAYHTALTQSADVEEEREPLPEPVETSVRETVASADSDVVRISRVEYPYLSEYVLPEPIQKMLIETPKGYRNIALGFLVRFLKTQYKFGQNVIREILTIWAEHACTPAYDKESFARDFARFYYQYNGLGYDPALKYQFGALDFDQLTLLRKQEIYIPNRVLRDLDKLDGKTVRLYLALKMLEHYEEPATQEKLAEALGISTRALRPTLQDLLSSGHGYMVKGNRRLGESSTYHTSRIISAHDGYMPLSYNDIHAYVNELYGQGTRGNGELKLYLFMLYKFHSKDIYMSQSTMGKHIGVPQTTISGIVSKLESRKFLRIRKKFRKNGIISYEYDLMR